MIINQSELNPLKDIIQLISNTARVLTIPLMNDIRAKLFSAGICCESDQEFEQCLEILRELGIVDIERIERGRILIKRGTNGQDTQ